MCKEKRPLLTLVPVLAALSAPIFRILPIDNDSRDMLMGVSIGISLATLGAIVALTRAARC